MSLELYEWQFVLAFVEQISCLWPLQISDKWLYKDVQKIKKKRKIEKGSSYFVTCIIILSKLTLPYTQGTLSYLIGLWRKTGGHVIKMAAWWNILQFIRWEVYSRVLHSAVQINHVTWYFFYVLFSMAGLSLDSVIIHPSKTKTSYIHIPFTLT